MCAYNKLNGVYCSENHMLLEDILKDEWGFEGLVVSDWGAVHDRVAALKGGLDLEMPGPKPRRTQAVMDAVRSGMLEEAVLDESVRRILNIVLRAAETPKGRPFDIPAHHALARHFAAEGMVLLKNDGILPLKKPQHISVIGRAVMDAHFQGGGSSHINPTLVDSPFEELKKLAGDARLDYCEGYPVEGEYDQALIDRATQDAGSADVAVLYLALPESKESEGYDRTDLDLTPHQVTLIKSVAAVQPKTVVILNNGAPIVMGEWINATAAVLEAWMMGQAGGGAIADVLFGRVNPSGKLGETFPLKLVDTPASINYPGGNGEVLYGEGLFIGYRYYDIKRAPVQFPFGYGLSYTTFAYSNPKVSAPTFKDMDGLSVSVDITNTGPVTGKEVIQLYVHDRISALVRPPKELKAFAKIELRPGETRTVTLTLDSRAFAYYHPTYKQWITEDGEFDLLLGASSADIRFTQTVKLQSTQKLPCLLDRESTVRAWMEDPTGNRVLGPLLKQMTAKLQLILGEDDTSEAAGMDTLGFMMDMPLRNVFHFQEHMLPESPEDTVDGLLTQVYGTSK